MNNIDVANGMIFQNLNISKDNFDERLICQKKIYLLQKLDLDLGYSYNWYIHGPYSPELTNYVYSNIDILSSYDFSKYTLSEDVMKKISFVNSISTDKPDEINETSWYELLASLIYIYENRKFWMVCSKEALFEVLMKYKPQFNSKQCEQALESLKKYTFISNEEERNLCQQVSN